jgi:hypothetical protein
MQVDKKTTQGDAQSRVSGWIRKGKREITGRQALIAVLIFACLMFGVTAYARSVLLVKDPNDTEYLPPALEERKAD